MKIGPSIRYILKAFLASPGDLSEEREIAHEVVNQLNSSIRRLSWQIELYRWEDIRPGFGRPQDQINKVLDECDLFIGLLWRRWGSPTGTHTSGFKEEFDRALQRRKKTLTSPAIWLAFKDVPSDLLKDPGIQLKEVLEFHDSQIELREVLFKNFKDSSEFRAKLYTWLLDLILDHTKPESENIESISNIGVSTQPLPQEAASPTISGKEDEQPAQTQISETLRAVGKMVTEGVPWRLHSEGAGLEPFQIARNHLISMTLMSLQIKDIVMGHHETNLLYWYRRNLVANSEELSLLFRTLISGENDLTPGWLWFTGLGSEQFSDTLSRYAIFDQNPRVRHCAFTLLTEARLPLPTNEELRNGINSVITSDGWEIARLDALVYLGTVGTNKELPAIGSGLVDKDELVRQGATTSKLLVLARSDVPRLLSEIRNDEDFLSKQVIAELRSSARMLDSKLLITALKHENKSIRLLVATELEHRNALTVEMARSLLDDESGQIKEVAYRCLIKSGEKIDPIVIYLAVPDQSYVRKHSRDSVMYRDSYADPEPLVLEVYRGYTKEELEELISWDLPMGTLAYKAMALYFFSEVGSRVRLDLQNEFREQEENYVRATTAWWEDRANQSYDLSMTQLSLSAFSLMSGRTSSPREMALGSAAREKAGYIAAALAGLSENGTPDDIVFARKYLVHNDYEVRRQSVQLISRLGDQQDIQALIELANTTEGELQELAVQTAMNLAKNGEDTIRLLLQTAKKPLVRIVIQCLLADTQSPSVLGFLEPFLSDRQDIVRLGALTYIVTKLEAEELKQILERYINQATYFYDVVCWLDRVLYPPFELRLMFIEKLKNELL